MHFFIAFIEVSDYHMMRATLNDFKDKIKQSGKITVLDFEQGDYDFFYNTFMERANNIKKGRK